ncbi:MAG: MFS transporter, partial [Acidobacteria bacterium]
MSATRVRAKVLAFAFLLAAVTYLDRICISAAAPFIMDDLHLSVVQMSVVFSAFTLAYSLFEIPSGWLGDVRGPRRVLTRIVLWWSAFTMLTGAARGFAPLVAI